MVYIRLFHGRKHPDQDLNGWGADGPILGPFEAVHTTYLYNIRVNDPDSPDWIDMNVYDDMIYYDNMFYGDWSIMSEDLLKREKWMTEPQQIDEEKTRMPADIDKYLKSVKI